MLSTVNNMLCCRQLLAWMDSRQKTDVHSIPHLSLWVPPGPPGVIKALDPVGSLECLFSTRPLGSSPRTSNPIPVLELSPARLTRLLAAVHELPFPR